MLKKEAVVRSTIKIKLFKNAIYEKKLVNMLQKR